MRTMILVLMACGCGVVRAGVDVDGGPVAADAHIDAQSTADAAMDAATPDARIVIDGGPLLPPVTNGQQAALVLGQPDFQSGTLNNGGISDHSLDAPSDVASAGSRLWIGDDLNNRVLQWNSAPVTVNGSANTVIGQTDFTSNASGTTQYSFKTFSSEGVCSDGTHLFVTDQLNNRVLMWAVIPISNGAGASIALGQTDWSTAAAGAGPGSLYQPRSCWTDGTMLVVVDQGNSRVLIWTSLPTQMGQVANIELGWPDFNMGAGDMVASPPTASSMKTPRAVTVDAGRLFVADAGNHRVLVWNQIPTVSGTPADFVVGQADEVSGSKDFGQAAVNDQGFYSPGYALVAGGSLFVSDTLNSRILVFTPVPTSSGAHASVVLGQPDLMTGTRPSAATRTNLCAPEGMTVIGNKLWVADTCFSRALEYVLTF